MTSGTIGEVLARWKPGLIARSNACDRALSAKPDGYTGAINLPKVSHLTSQYAMLRCGHVVVTSQEPPSPYLRFPIPNYAITHSL